MYVRLEKMALWFAKEIVRSGVLPPLSVSAACLTGERSRRGGRKSVIDGRREKERGLTGRCSCGLRAPELLTTCDPRARWSMDREDGCHAIGKW
jgi:hypothetical protein